LSSSSTTDGESADETDKGYAVTFQCDEHVSVIVYADQEMETDGEKTNTTVSLDKDTGEPTSSGEGQVNFLLVFDEGYSLDDIKVDGTIKNLKGYPETFAENLYRITRIESDLTVTISVRETAAEEDFTQGYLVKFNTDDHVRVVVYRTQALTNGEETTVAYSRNDSTGALSKDGTGQVNFLLIFDEGYSLGTIDVVEGTYNQLKYPSKTKEGCYRITKIESELVVTVTSSPTA
jgi:hypothetical protein